MSDQLALLRAIADAYDDDAPRLAYADWLQERGGKHDLARAELIRTQIECTRRSPSDPGQDELKKKADALAKKHRAAWLAPFGKAFIREAHFHRGFIDAIELPARSLDPARPLPWHFEPCATVWVKGDEEEAIRALPALAGAYGVWFDLGEDDEPEGDTDLVPPDFAGDRLAAAVAAIPGLASLRSLGIAGLAEQVSDHGARVLAASPLRRLRNLSLWWNWMTPAGWKALADSPIMDTVEELDLSSYEGMEREESGYDYPSDRGAAAVAASPRMARVRVLKLSNSKIEKAGAAALAASPHFGALEELRLSSLEWRAAPLAALLTADPFPRLRDLDLGINRLAADAMEVLARSPVLARLTHLHLGFNRINPAALAALLAAPDLSRLQDLNLMDNPVGDAGVKELARCTKLTGLRRLCLADCRLTGRSATALLAAPWLNQLEDLDLENARLPESARNRLEKRLGKAVSFR